MHGEVGEHERGPMETLFGTFGTTVCLSKAFFKFCDLIAVGVALKLGDLESDGQFEGPLFVIRSDPGHWRCPSFAAPRKVIW